MGGIELDVILKLPHNLEMSVENGTYFRGGAEEKAPHCCDAIVKIIVSTRKQT